MRCTVIKHLVNVFLYIRTYCAARICDILYATMLSLSWLVNHVINYGSPVWTQLSEPVFRQLPSHLWMQQKVEMATPPMPLYL